MKGLFFSIIFAIIFLGFSTFGFGQQGNKRYSGTPATDTKFISFIMKNVGKLVTLNLSISNGEMISEGYKGVQPMFDGKKTSGIDYSFFLECPNDVNLTPIEECKAATWVENDNGGGTLSGNFKVSRIIKTSMRNYRAVFLIPVRR
jgi:hypothetical protein